MLIVIQFPLADVRRFLYREVNQLNTPTWPVPEPDKNFIRRSGIVRRRLGGGIDDWPAEEIYCSAKRAIRFKERLKYLTLKNCVFPISCSFRRFFYDGEVVARVEVGLEVLNILEVQAVLKDVYLDGSQCLELIDACLSIPVKIPFTREEFISTALINAAPSIAKHYLQSTTRRVNGKLSSFENWWIIPGTPLVMIDHSQSDIKDFPEFSKKLNPYSSENDIHYKHNILHFCRVECRGKRINVLFHQNNYYSKAQLQLQRQLRLHIFRLHAQRECLKQILRLIAQEKINPKSRSSDSDHLQKYLRDSMRLISRKKRYGIEQSKLLDIAQQFEETINPGERKTLLSQLERINIRKNIYNNVKNFTKLGNDSFVNFHVIGDGTVINTGKMLKVEGDNMAMYKITFGDNAKVIGDFVVADSIQNSFNRISKSEVSEELKDRLKNLSEAVANMCTHLPENMGREAARDVEIISGEVLSNNPRCKWYKMSAEGLIKTAKTVGHLADPVIRIVKELLTLLS